MRIALIGDFDTYLTRGLDRPRELLPSRLPSGLNLLRGLQALGTKDIHLVIVTREVQAATVEEGPFGTVHRLPCPKFSGSTSFFLWRRHLILRELAAIKPEIVNGFGTEEAYGLTAVTAPYRHAVTWLGILQRVHQVAPVPLLSLNHVPHLLEKVVFQKARHAICNTRYVESMLQTYRSPAHCHQIPVAVAPCFFQVPALAPATGEPRLVFVGSLYQLKGLVYLVEALPKIQDQLKTRVHLSIIGTAGQRQDALDYVAMVRRKLTASSLDGQVEWLGSLSEQAVAAVLGRSHVLVLPSLEETFGMCVAEAMAAGRPVVASRVGGLPEVVRPGVTGLLVTPGQVQELADALVTLLADVNLQRRMGLAARQVALDDYAPVVVAQKTLATYEMICQESDSGSVGSAPACGP